MQRGLRIAVLIIKMLFLGHMLGCLWYGVSALYDVVGVDESGETSWRASYADGVVADASTPMDVRYLISAYWAVVTMTTVGYGDLTPQNELEVIFCCLSILFSALTFGYMLSNVGVLIASIDRQAAVIEEATDSMKEYVEWRGLPKNLGIRVKKHVASAFQKSRGFDEAELISGLSPQLRNEVTRHVLSETLGKLPLFADIFDTELQLEIFPHIKPVSYERGETIFRKGELARELMFLLSGEVHMMNPVNNKVAVIMSKSEQTVLRHDAPKPLVTIEHRGAFGETVLTGMRRPMTHIAHDFTETLALSRRDLQSVFSKQPRIASRIASVLLESAAKLQRLRTLMTRFVIAQAPEGSAVRAALTIQMAWNAYLLKTNAEHAPLARAGPPPPKTAADLFRNRALDKMQAEVLRRIGELREDVAAGRLPEQRAWRAEQAKRGVSTKFQKPPRSRGSVIADTFINAGRDRRSGVVAEAPDVVAHAIASTPSQFIPSPNMSGEAAVRARQSALEQDEGAGLW